LRRIAKRTRRLALLFAAGLKAQGAPVDTEFPFFDTVEVAAPPERVARALELARQAGMNLRDVGGRALGVSFDETSSREDVEALLRVFAQAGIGKAAPSGASDLLRAGASAVAAAEASLAAGAQGLNAELPPRLRRESAFLQQKIFNSYQCETEMLRYLFRLQGKDLSLAHSMIPLGSCTMKLNATAEMIPVTWPEFSGLHPFAPLDQAQGMLRMIRQLEGWLREITGFAAVSVQPNAGSQGEYAGLLAIRGYHQSRGDGHRDVCLIPSSAHGTNPASATMGGMRVVVVKCDERGNVDVADLRARALEFRDRLAALMITYPSTHGVFEEPIVEICEIIHQSGGQVYMDGANLNALVGLCRPSDFGADVCHLNLHKTFCIPHGGGGPGVGPIGVREHLRPFLPGHTLVAKDELPSGGGAVSAAPWGSASILCISWAYIAMMGRDGLKQATQVAILSANYVARRLAPHYPVLYKGTRGMVAHECIIDLRQLTGASVEDACKRLMDYGFHAPTMSWPVAGTLMIEPTESEAKAELDRFCDAMIAIREEIARVESGEWPKDDNPLKNAPHTAQDIARTDWSRPYSREMAAFPLPWTRERKFWPAVGRVNNPQGDRNFTCSCAPLEDYL
jgi:glycine dehydrogenase